MNNGSAARTMGWKPQIALPALTDSLNSRDLSESVSVNGVNGIRYAPFPTRVLPRIVSEYVTAAASAIGCYSAFIALPMLCCLGRAIGNSRSIRLKRTWMELAIFWAAIIGKSGTHKTPALQAATKFIQEKQARAIADHTDSLQGHQDDKALHERNYAEWKRSKSNEPPPAEPLTPTCNRFVTSDSTIEALAKLLHDQFDGLLVVRDELAGWINGIAEYKNGKGSDLGHWLAAWSGAPMTVDRKTGPVTFIHTPRASISLVGGIQPGVLQNAIGREHMQDGLCARLLMAMPDPRPVIWTDDTIDWAIELKMAGVFGQLFKLQPNVNADGDQEPLPLDMTDEAKAVWVDYFNRHRAEAADLDDNLAAAWSKLEAYTARFALTFQLANWAAGDAGGDAIDEASMEAACQLSDWFGGEAKRVYGLFSETDSDRESRELLEVVRRKAGRLTPRDLMRCYSKYHTALEAELALAALVTSGAGSWEVIDTGTNQKREFVLLTPIDTDTFAQEPGNR